MPADTANVIPLKRPEISPEGWGQREQDALLIARLAALPAIDYERARAAAARQFKCRVSWLDRTIEAIRSRVAEVQHLPPAKDGRTTVGEPINFVHDNGERVLGFLVASYHQRGEDHHLIVLADGNATVISSVPLSDERIVELKNKS